MARKKNGSTRNLPVKLTDTELNQRRDNLANMHQQHDVVEQEKSDANKAFNEKLKKLQQVMSLTALEPSACTPPRVMT